MQKTLIPLYPSENDCFADAEIIDTQLSKVPIGGLPLYNLRFADNIDLLGGRREEELRQLTERLEKTAAGYSMEISSDKCKIIVNSINPIAHTNIWTNGKALAEVDQFKYLASTQTNDGISIKEVKN